MRAFKTYICVEKNYVFADLRYLGSQITNPQIAKLYGPQMANLQIYTFEEGPQIYFKKLKSGNLQI
jgi:hypothetical protein